MTPATRNHLLDFFIRELGPAVYNQGVLDATASARRKLEDIEGDIHEREAWRRLATSKSPRRV